MCRRFCAPALRVLAILVLGVLPLAGTAPAFAAQDIRLDKYFKACAGTEPEFSLDQRIDGCSTLIVLNPTFADGFYLRGVAYSRKGDIDKAIDDFDHAIALKPTHIDALIGRGQAYYIKGSFDLAIADFKQALRFDPNNKYAAASLRLVQDDKSATH
jgi:tetratricopeptide (TPR) repeat protein